MTDLSSTIAPKSDQLNADDLISGPLTVTITRVSANPSSAEQPIVVGYEGDNGRPYLPCKSMRRVMVAVWGPDGATYPGKSMTLYRDPGVTFGGVQVGGIRISHMSGLDKPMTMALTATRAARKPFTVKPLAAQQRAPQEPPAPTHDATPARSLREIVEGIEAKLRGCTTEQQVHDLTKTSDVHGIMTGDKPKARERVNAALAAALARTREAAPEDLDDAPPAREPELA